MRKALEAWLERAELVRCCEEMGAARRREVTHERMAACFEIWSRGTAQQRAIEHQVCKVFSTQTQCL